MSKIKTFVVDTNVILHDSSCLYHFENNSIVIPITVLEELDRFKKGNDAINFHAREFLRALDTLSGERLFNGGVAVAEGLGRVSVSIVRDFHPDLRLSFTEDNPDHRILNVAYTLAQDNPSQEVVLISKDVNLRMKAKAVGLCAQDYRTDQVRDISRLYTGMRRYDTIDNEIIDALYTADAEVPARYLEWHEELTPNEYVILRNGNKSVLASYHAQTDVLHRVDKVRASGILPRNAEQTFALHALMNPDVQLVTLAGKAGTGKTLLALAAALNRANAYGQIFMSRPVVPLSNKDLGYLPGDITSKMDPYIQPLYDNLGVIKGQFNTEGSPDESITRMLEEKRLVISPLAYIRGRSLVNIYFIVDEAQNLTPHEVKTIISRAGEGTKIVLTGDIFQIDHPYLDTQSNGLSHLIEKMQGQQLYAHVTLTKGERSPLAELASNLL